MIPGHTDVLDSPSSVQGLQANPVLNDNKDSSLTLKALFSSNYLTAMPLCNLNWPKVVRVSNLTKSPRHGEEEAEKCNLGGLGNRSCSTTTTESNLQFRDLPVRGQNWSECPIWIKPETGCFLWH
ncbi:hypothetical protein CsSME_00005784 [Camellia sinensis var. sinensis]